MKKLLAIALSTIALALPLVATPNQRPARLDLPLSHPKILIRKGQRKLFLYSHGRLVRTFHVALGFSPVGDKEREGDGRTPEGDFYIFTKNENSAFYLSLGISYPRLAQAKRGLRKGLITPEQYQQIAKALREKTAPPQTTRLGGRSTFTGTEHAVIGHGAAWRWRMQISGSCTKPWKSEHELQSNRDAFGGENGRE